NCGRVPIVAAANELSRRISKMLCSVCGANVPEGASVCANCGSPVAVSTSAPSAQQVPPNRAMPPTPAILSVPPAPPPTDGKATPGLVLGILSWVGPGLVAGVPAIILGHMSRSAIRKSMGRLKGDGMALAGLVLGYVSTVLSILLLIAVFAGMLAFLNIGKSRMFEQQQAANEIRMINANQSTYQVTYSTFARDLASLGHRPGDNCPSVGTAEHACLLADELGNPECTGSTWCSKGGYKFHLQGVDCKKNKCDSYLLVATPEDAASKLP